MSEINPLGLSPDIAPLDTPFGPIRVVHTCHSVILYLFFSF